MSEPYWVPLGASGELTDPAARTLLTFAPDSGEPTGTYATVDGRNDRICLDFDATVDEEQSFCGVLPRHYNATGLIVVLWWAATSAVSGTVRWDVAFERLASLDLDTSSFAASQTAGGTANGTSGVLTATSIPFTDAQIDGLQNGEPFRMRVKRDADGTSGTDDMTGDAELYLIEILEG